MPQDPTADVSVVLVNWNSGADLVRSVRSVFESAGEARVELIVVDNHSRDGSHDRAEQACPEIKLIRNETNRGFGAACNQGMRAGTAPWVFLLNRDARVT